MERQQANVTQHAARAAPPRERHSANGPAESGKPAAPAAMPPRRTWLSLLLILVANFFLIRLLFPNPNAPVKVPYTLFKQEVAKRNVKQIYSRGESLTGLFNTSITYPLKPDSTSSAKPRSVTTFATTVPAFVDPGLESLLITNGVEIRAEPIQQGNSWMNGLLSFAPALLIIALYVWMYRRAAQPTPRTALARRRPRCVRTGVPTRARRGRMRPGPAAHEESTQQSCRPRCSVRRVGARTSKPTRQR